MINFLKTLLGICVHQYETVQSREIIRVKDSNKIGVWVIQKCKHCNKYKENKFYV